MRLGTGIHPRHWHAGAWLLVLALLLLALLLSHRPSGGLAYAQTATAPDAGATRPDTGYVMEVVDSTYTIGPAEFFALDLPTVQADYRAMHLFGTASTKGRGKDIIVRLFKASDYDHWLKRKSGVKAEPFWISKKARNVNLDQVLPLGEPIVLLLDNGFSLRTPKTVSLQLQLRYEPNPTRAADIEGASSAGPEDTGKTPADTSQSNLPPPRSNTEEEMPPPPPPPPAGY
jgi:hypothetical protein